MADEEVSATWNGKSVSARGFGVYAILAVLAIIAAILYTGFETKEAIRQLTTTMTAEHRSLRIAQDKTSCILSLTLEERSTFRLRYQQGSFRQWCPWMED